MIIVTKTTQAQTDYSMTGAVGAETTLNNTGKPNRLKSRRIFLVFSLLLLVFWGFGNKAVGQTWNISDQTRSGNNVTAVLSGNKLTISGSGNMADFYETNWGSWGLSYSPNFRPPWYNYRTNIHTVEIGYGIKNIGDGAFEDCYNLISIEIPNSVIQIGITSFMNCTSLKNITLHDCIETVEGGAFYGCNALTVDIIKRDNLNIIYNSNYVHGNEYPFNGISKLRVMPFRINNYPSNGYLKEILYDEKLSITHAQQSISGTYNLSFACVSPSVCATVYKVSLTEGIIYTFSPNFMLGYVWLYSDSGTQLVGNSGWSGDIDNYQSVFTGEAYLFVGMNTGYGCYPLSLTYRGYLSTPTGIFAKQNGSSDSISWKDVPAATSYKIYRSSSGNGTYTEIGTSTSTNYIDNSPLSGYNYYKIEAHRNANPTTQSNLSNYAYVNYTTPSCATLTSPANNATNVATSATLTWNAVSNATSYDVYVGTNSNPPYETTVTGTSYSPSLVCGNTYYWQIVPKNSSGSASGCITRTFTTVSCGGQLSNDATLSNLMVSNGTLTPVFHPNTTTYTVNVVNWVTSVDISATPNHNKASVNISQKASFNVNVGSNLFNIVVTAEDGTKKTYTVDVTRAGGIGINEVVEKQLKVYPNPTTGQLRITNYELREGAVIEIYDVVGQLVYQINKPTNQQQISKSTNNQINNTIIDISHLANGMYFLKIDNKVVKFLKE